MGIDDRKKDRCGILRAAIVLEAALLLAIGVIFAGEGRFSGQTAIETTSDGYIKWVDFNVSYEALCRAYDYDVTTYGQKIHLDWIDLLAYVGRKIEAISDRAPRRTSGRSQKKFCPARRR